MTLRPSPRAPAKTRKGPWRTPAFLGAALLGLAACVTLVVLAREEEPAPSAAPLELPVRSEPAQPPAPLPPAQTAPPTIARVAEPAPSEPQRRVTPRRRDQGPQPVAPPAEEEEEVVIVNEPGKEYPAGVDARELIETLRGMGVTDGIAAFPPPGTNPPKAGLVVPSDYDVPEGYERYYQYTDDGKPLAPILVYSPDYEFFDEQGNPVEIPEDRTVPADQAPPGLDVEILDPTKPLDPERLIDRAP